MFANIRKNMYTLPAPFEERMKKQLAGEASAFFDALKEAPPVSIRSNPGKSGKPEQIFPPSQVREPVSWCENACYLAERPVFTLDPFFHGGAYYVQEASSMFLHHILKQILPSGPVRVLDLCAAPGGKSTLTASLLPADSLLVSNEVIRSRASILKENIIKWGHTNIVVTNNDPADFRPYKGAFDLILVDAPCSGEGMFRKDPESIREWSENNLRLCSERQRRILSDIWECLKPEGYLIYSTCTYNREENETILLWLTQHFQAKVIPIPHTYASITPGVADFPCYQFYPHKTKGEGFFTGVVQKQDGAAYSPRKDKKNNSLKSFPLPKEIRNYIPQPEQYFSYQAENRTGIIPNIQADFIHQLEHSLRILYKGCELAEINNRKIKLLPPLALWHGLNKQECEIYETDLKTALTYLKKEDIPNTSFQKDWLLISYREVALGWCKNLGTRLNNYYPKEWRIRMNLD